MSESENQQVAPVDSEAARPTEAETTAPAESQETDWVAEARKWEKRAKENASKLKEAEPKLSEYDRLVEASKSELERAQEAARKAGETITAMRARVVAADIRAALTGVVPDPVAVIEDLNISRFIGEDGEVNADAVTALRNKYAALSPPGVRPPAPNPAQGTSGGGITPGLDAQIAEATKAGDFQRSIALKQQRAAERKT